MPDRPADARLLFLTRGLRLFAYGLLSVILVLNLAATGLDEREIGLLLLGAGLMAFAGLLFASTRAFAGLSRSAEAAAAPAASPARSAPRSPPSRPGGAAARVAGPGPPLRHLVETESQQDRLRRF
ncbi:MAG TPA: LPXTG cell wall anchor domain-containing protein [Vicinamibacteria bacterium]|nr:LPXTG cell wall anchor domain-containing protein [Vicinamibacteria bacterium]